MSATVDRDALIEAMAHALHDQEHTEISCSEPECWAESPGWERAIYLGEAAAALDVVLPLIADAIEAGRPHIPPSTDMKRREAIIVRCTLNRAARLVRSLGGAS